MFAFIFSLCKFRLVITNAYIYHFMSQMSHKQKRQRLKTQMVRQIVLQKKLILTKFYGNTNGKTKMKQKFMAHSPVRICKRGSTKDSFPKVYLLEKLAPVKAFTHLRESILICIHEW